jgi:transposase InsO family protein
MDFGFMRASSDAFTQQAGATRIVESHDGYNSYLLIVDAKTRCTWIFLTASKAPPVDHVSCFLNAFGLASGYRAVHVDQGGELWRSADFKYVVAQAGYILKPTGADSPHQNGKAERLNGTFGAMVCSLLYSSGLPPKYWWAALVHAVHLKNCHCSCC